jgi:hypothetical protein
MADRSAQPLIERLSHEERARWGLSGNGLDDTSPGAPGGDGENPRARASAPPSKRRARVHSRP